MNENRLALDLFLCDTIAEAKKITKELTKIKETQKKLAAELFENFEDMIIDQIDNSCYYFIIDESYGTLGGLLATRASDKWKRPCIVLHDRGDTYAGSMRATGVENFSKIINSPDAANSTANVSFMLVEVIKDGKRLCQILEAPGEYYFNPNNPSMPFPSYVNTIIASNNRKLWTIMVEPDWRDTVDRINYVQRINDLSKQMDVKDKTLFVFNKIDKTNFTRKKGQINIPQAREEISNLYPGIFEMFKNQNPITKLWKDYLCGFVPFQTGTYTITTKKDSKGNSIWNYQEGPDNYPQMLWNEIQKSITG
jgi:hypothetical protein